MSDSQTGHAMRSTPACADSFKEIDHPAEPRRVGYIDIDPDVLLAVLARLDGSERNGERIDVIGLPIGARGLRAGISDTGAVRIVVESESLQYVAPGDAIPKLPITLHAYRMEEL